MKASATQNSGLFTALAGQWRSTELETAASKYCAENSFYAAGRYLQEEVANDVDNGQIIVDWDAYERGLKLIPKEFEKLDEWHCYRSPYSAPAPLRGANPCRTSRVELRFRCAHNPCSVNSQRLFYKGAAS